MRLVFIIGEFSVRAGGAEGFAVTLCRRLAARGHEVHVVARRGGETGDGVAVHGGVESAEQASEFARKLEPDVCIDWGLTCPADLHRLGGGVHAEFLHYNRLRRHGLMRLGKHIEEWLPKHRRIIARERRLLTAPGTHVLAVSDFVARQARHFAALGDDRITILRNGVDTERFRPCLDGGERAEYRKSLDLAPDNVAYLFVGHNLGLKNLGLIQRVFGGLVEAIPGARLLVAGKRRPRKTAPWLRFLGPGTRIEAVYRAADVLVHPTYYDACANVVLEALASGLPVVSSEYNGSAEIITPERDGFVLPVAERPRSEIEQAWFETLLRLGRDPALRAAVGSRARELAGEHSIETYVAEFEALLARLSPRR